MQFFNESFNVRYLFFFMIFTSLKVIIFRVFFFFLSLFKKIRKLELEKIRKLEKKIRNFLQSHFENRIDL